LTTIDKGIGLIYNHPIFAKEGSLRSHTYVLEDWHNPKLEEVAKREKVSVSWVARYIYDRLLPSITKLSDIDSIITKVNDDGNEAGAE
jgi:hypothetical protein